MQIKKQFISAMLAMGLLVSCSGQATGEPTVDINAVMTSGVETFVAGLTQTQAAVATLATQTPSPTLTVSPVSLNSVTPPSTSTQSILVPVLPTTIIFPTLTGTQYTSTVSPSSLGSGCNNLGFIGDVTVSSGTVMTPGQEFTKTWKVENNGTCDWALLYRMVFVGGERMGGEGPALGKVIPPGKWTQISIGFIAPDKPGKYTGSWRLGTQAGSVFGATLTVSIVVAHPTATPVPPTTYP